MYRCVGFRTRVGQGASDGERGRGGGCGEVRNVRLRLSGVRKKERKVKRTSAGELMREGWNEGGTAADQSRRDETGRWAGWADGGNGACWLLLDGGGRESSAAHNPNGNIQAREKPHCAGRRKGITGRWRENINRIECR